MGSGSLRQLYRNKQTLSGHAEECYPPSVVAVSPPVPTVRPTREPPQLALCILSLQQPWSTRPQTMANLFLSTLVTKDAE